MTIFYTPFERYEFLGMSFELRMSQAIFQRKTDQIYRTAGVKHVSLIMCRYLIMRKHVIGIGMKQWSALGRQALNLILINALFRLNFVVSLVTCTFQRESRLIQRKWKPSKSCNHPSISNS